LSCMCCHCCCYCLLLVKVMLLLRLPLLPNRPAPIHTRSDTDTETNTRMCLLPGSQLRQLSCCRAAPAACGPCRTQAKRASGWQAAARRRLATRHAAKVAPTAAAQLSCTTVVPLPFRLWSWAAVTKLYISSCKQQQQQQQQHHTGRTGQPTASRSYMSNITREVS
jgi:hypothetical protein